MGGKARGGQGVDDGRQQRGALELDRRERFTETPIWLGHPAASSQALRSTQAPIFEIRPISSASGMKVSGDIIHVSCGANGSGPRTR